MAQWEHRNQSAAVVSFFVFCTFPLVWLVEKTPHKFSKDFAHLLEHVSGFFTGQTQKRKISILHLPPSIVEMSSVEAPAPSEKNGRVFLPVQEQ